MAVLVGGLFVGQAQAVDADAFVISGGTTQQQEIVRDALETCTWDWAAFGGEPSTITLTTSHPPYWGSGIVAAGTDDQLAFPFVEEQTIWGVSYWPSQDIYINANVTDPALLREVAVHEGAHARVMFVWFWDRPQGSTVYDCYALEAWRELIGEYGDIHAWMHSPVESHAEWFRVTYLDPALQLHQTARSNLPAPAGGTDGVRAFHDEWCAPSDVTPIAWGDLPVDDSELIEAAHWAWSEGYWEGYPDGTFHPWQPVLERHVALVASRVGLPAPNWTDRYGVATRGQVRDAIPGLLWLEERWDEPLTRSQLLRLMYRSRDGLDVDPLMGAKLDEWFAETYVTWNGVTRQPRLMGRGALIVQQAREHDVPLWLCLGMGWYESQWATTGLSVDLNCAWGMKDADGKWGALRAVVSGFADYVSVDEMIRAYFRLMDSYVYRDLIDAGDWDALLERYAPSWQNDHQAHMCTVFTVRSWCEARGIW